MATSPVAFISPEPNRPIVGDARGAWAENGGCGCFVGRSVVVGSLCKSIGTKGKQAFANS